MMDREPFILAQLDDLSSVFAPLKSTTRIKYTCFNVSANLLVMGATSGGLYVFRREPCVFLQLIPSKEGTVVQLAISPDEKLLGVATARGSVSLVERNQRGARVVAVSYEHSGSTVTSLTWGGAELFIGDAQGRVSVLTRTVFQPPAALLMQLDSRVVQLDSKEGLLVASTMTRCYVCDTERELYKQVGQKMRDGPFGGCFVNTDDADETAEAKSTDRARGIFSDGLNDDRTSRDYSQFNHLKVFCTRPGARVWEGDVEGTVLRTHNFRDALAKPPRPITTDQSFDNNNKQPIKNNQQPVNFGCIYAIVSRFLLTYTSDAVFVLDPERSDIVVWCNQIQDIVDVRVTDNIIYVWCATGRMHALNLVPLEKFLIRMYFWKKYTMVAELSIEFAEYLKSHAPHSTKLHLLKDLDDKLKEHNEISEEMSAALVPLLEILCSNAQHTQFQNARKLKSGIYQITRPNYLNLKLRSHSVSPDRMNKTQCGGSTSSLPELVMEEEEVAEEADVAADKDLVAAVLELCPRMAAPSPKPAEVRELILRVLRLCDKDDPLTAARELPLRKIFSPEFVSAISKGFHTALTTRTLVAILKEMPAPLINDVYGRKNSSAKTLDTIQHLDNAKNTYLNKNETSHEITCDNSGQSHPEYLMKTVASEALLMDLKLSRVLKIFNDVLDEDHVLDGVRTALPQCYFLCLLEVTSKFNTVGMSLNESLSPPRALSVVAFLLKVGQVDQICRWSHTLDLRDVTYLIMSREVEDVRGSQVAFLSLMDGWSINTHSHLVQQEQYLLHCLQTLQPSAACHCGFPVPETRKHTSRRFYNLGTQLLESKKDPAEAVRVCGIMPWLWPHLLKMREEDGLLKLLPLILHLGDLDELESRLAEMDSLLCEVVVRHLAGLHRGDCLNCGRKLPPCNAGISWTQVALLLVKAVGHSETLRLLTQYKADVNGLEPVFHRAVVLAAIMEKHSTGLRHSVVDIFSGRTCGKTSLMSPSLQKQLCPSTPLTPGPNHWGLKLDTNAICSVCSLLLTARVLTEAGVIAFPCRHAFHAVCLRTRDVCPVCSSPTKC